VSLDESGNTIKIDQNNNVVNAKIKDTSGNTITSLTTPSNCVGAIKTALFGSINNAVIGDTNANPHGTTKTGLNNFIVNSYSLPVICGGFDGTNTQGFKTTTTGNQIVAIDTANNTVGLSATANTIKIDTSNNTVKLDTSNNTVQFSQTSNQNNIKITDAGGDIATISTPWQLSGTSSIRGVDTQACLNSYNVYNNTYDNLTMTPSDSGPSNFYKALDVYARNPSTTNDYSKVGLNVYNITPKRINYVLSGQNVNNLTNMLFGGVGCQTNFPLVNFGKAFSRNWYASKSAGIVRDIILTYDYVNSAGDIVPNQTYTLTTTNSIIFNGISVNKWSINTALGTGEIVYISYNSNILNSIAGGTFPDYYNGVITVPNGYIG